MVLPLAAAAAIPAAASAGGGFLASLFGGGAGLAGFAGGALRGLAGGSSTKVQTNVSQSTSANLAVSPVISNVTGGSLTNPAGGGDAFGDATSPITAGPQTDRWPSPDFFAGPGAYGPAPMPKTNFIADTAAAGDGGSGLAGLFSDPLSLGLLGLGAFMLFKAFN